MRAGGQSRISHLKESVKEKDSKLVDLVAAPGYFWMLRVYIHLVGDPKKTRAKVVTRKINGKKSVGVITKDAPDLLPRGVFKIEARHRSEVSRAKKYAENIWSGKSLELGTLSTALPAVLKVFIFRLLAHGSVEEYIRQLCVECENRAVHRCLECRRPICADHTVWRPVPLWGVLPYCHRCFRDVDMASSSQVALEMAIDNNEGVKRRKN